MENFWLGIEMILIFIFYGILAILSPLWGPVWLVGWVARNKFGKKYTDMMYYT